MNKPLSASAGIGTFFRNRKLKAILLVPAAIALVAGHGRATPPAAIATQTETTVYFLAAGPRHSQSRPTPEAAEYESFVVPVSNPTMIAEIRSLIRRAESPVVNVRIRTGNDGRNRNFYAPNAPAWNWSVIELISIQGEPRSIFAPCCPAPGELPENEYGSVSMIASDPEAITADGDDILIGGITVNGSRPKQVAVRCSGNHLLAPHGIFTRVTTPRIRVFSADGTQVANLKSARDYELISRFPGLMHPDLIRHRDTLAIITLYPGQYTFHVYDENGRTGVVLFELYDLSLAPKPFP